MGFSIEDEMAEFFEGDSPDYSLELDDLHRGDMAFLATGVVLSAIQSKQMGEPRVAERKMALAEKVMGEIPDEDVPDAPLPTRLAAIQRQLDERDVVTTADVQALGREIQPVVSGLAEALQPVLEAFRDLANDLADAFSAIDLDADAQDDGRDSRLPESIREARERRRRQRDQVENELGDFRYP